MRIVGKEFIEHCTAGGGHIFQWPGIDSVVSLQIRTRPVDLGSSMREDNNSISFHSSAAYTTLPLLDDDYKSGKIQEKKSHLSSLDLNQKQAKIREDTTLKEWSTLDEAHTFSWLLLWSLLYLLGALDMELEQKAAVLIEPRLHQRADRMKTTTTKN